MMTEEEKPGSPPESSEDAENQEETQLLPGQRWLERMEYLFLLRPVYIGRQKSWKYRTGIVLVLVGYVFHAGRLMIGAIWPDIGLKMANYFNFLGPVGQMISGAGAWFYTLVLYFRLLMLSKKDLSFVEEYIMYDDPNHPQAILNGEYRGRAVQFLKKALNFLSILSLIMVMKTQFDVLSICIISPIWYYGVTPWNVFYWTLNGTPLFVILYYVAMDWVYIFGSWYLGKCHLDFQADYLMDQIEALTNEKSSKYIDVGQIAFLDQYYKKLITRTKRFDEFSKDLIPPYRFSMAYVAGAVAFSAHQTDSFILQVGLDSIAVGYYVCTLIFLYTATSLSVRRRKMFRIANSLYVKVSRQQYQKGETLMSLNILRRMIKSLGDDDCHTLCLTDKSGQELDPMEFVEFVLDTFANFALVANLYWDYVRTKA